MHFVFCRAVLAAFVFGVVLGAQAVASDFEDDPDFTDRRHGFIIGFAVGPGYSHIAQDVEPGWLGAGFEQFGGDVGKLALNTDFKIGLATDEQTLLYWNTKVSWLSQKISRPELDENAGQFRTVMKNEIFASALSGLGISYYFHDQLPSRFISLTMGFTSLATPFMGNDHGEAGYGAALGIGYEFAPHLILEGTLSYCHTSNYPVKTDIISLRATFGLLSF